MIAYSATKMDIGTLLWGSVAGRQVILGVDIVIERLPRVEKDLVAGRSPMLSDDWRNQSEACMCYSLAPRDSLSVPGLAHRAALLNA